MDHVVAILPNNWFYLPKLFITWRQKMWKIEKGKDIIQLSLVQNMQAKFSYTHAYEDEK